jgi:hypothetical protein
LEHRTWHAREIESIEVEPHTEVPLVIQGTFELFVTGGSAGAGPPAEGGGGTGSGRRIPLRPGAGEHEALAILHARFGSPGVFRIELQPGRIPEQRFSRIEISPGRYALRTGSPGTKPTGPISPDTVDPWTERGGISSSPTEDGENHHPGGVPRIRIRRILIGGAVAYDRTLPPVRYGPFVYAGEWWNGDETDRIYSYRGYPGDALLWGYRTVTDARWIVQGWLS